MGALFFPYICFMAIIQPSALITGIKGKLGGGIFQYNAGGNIVRTRTSHQNQKFPRWQLRKTQMTYLSQSWRALSDANRTAWEAMTVSYPTVDKWGNPRDPSGFELYIRLNYVLQAGGFTLLTVPIAPIALTAVNMTAPTFGGGATISANWDVEFDTDERLIIFAAPPCSPGVSHTSRAYRALFVMANDASKTKNINTLYVAQFGAIPVGSRVFVKGKLFNKDTGQEAIATYGSAVA